MGSSRGAVWRDTSRMEGDRKDFFVSHAGADRAWAEWVAWQLTDAGYTVELDVWDWAAGQNFMTAMSDALDRCDRVVALFSAAYFDRSRYTTRSGRPQRCTRRYGEGRLVPLRVEDVPTAEMPAVLRPLLFRDLFGVDEEQARRGLLEAVAGPTTPDHQPVFPGRGTPGEIEQAGRGRSAAAGQCAAGVERPGPQSGVHRPGWAAGGGAGAAAGRGPGGGAGVPGHGRGGQDPAGGRVRAPVRRDAMTWCGGLTLSRPG